MHETNNSINAGKYSKSFILICVGMEVRNMRKKAAYASSFRYLASFRK